MTWLGVTAVGFLLVLGLVVWLARGSTARWEREKRAARAPVPPAEVSPPSPAGVATRLRRALVRTAGAVPRALDRPRGRLGRAVARLSPGRRMSPRVRPVGRVLRPLRSLVRERDPAGLRRRRRPFRLLHRSHGDGASGDAGRGLEPGRRVSRP